MVLASFEEEVRGGVTMTAAQGSELLPGQEQ